MMIFWNDLPRIKKCYTFRVNPRPKLAAALTRAFKGLAALASLVRSLKVARLGKKDFRPERRHEKSLPGQIPIQKQ
eukprot:1143374-Pelagomonas_calceolata.AAC.2